MFGVPILEVAIGLSFIYLLLSLVCTTMNEAIASAVQRRGKMLAEAIHVLVGDAGMKDKIYSHPLITSMVKEKNSLPSYIPAARFALALMDTLTGAENPANDSKALKAGLDTASPHLKTALSAVLADSRSHLLTDQQKIEAWYSDAMDRVSGWYKRKTTLWIWAIAAVVTLALDANTMGIVKILWSNQAVRSAVVEAAKNRSQAGQSGEPAPLVEYADPQHPEASKPVNIPQQLTDDERQTLGSLLPGWKQDWESLSSSTGWEWTGWLISHLLGWILTVLALSLGAPFWFDTLNKFMNIRNAGRATDEPRDKSNPSQPSADGERA